MRSTAAFLRCLAALVCAPFHRHRVPSLWMVERMDNGYYGYRCLCGALVPLTADWTAKPGTQLPSTDASAFLTCDRLDAREVDEHERAKVRLRETLGLKAEGFRRLPE